MTVRVMDGKTAAKVFDAEPVRRGSAPGGIERPDVCNLDPKPVADEGNPEAHVLLGGAVAMLHRILDQRLQQAAGNGTG